MKKDNLVKVSIWGLEEAPTSTHLFQHAVQYQGHRNKLLRNWIQQVIIISHIDLGGDDKSRCTMQKMTLPS